MTGNFIWYPAGEQPCYACNITAVVQLDGVMQCLSCGATWYTYEQANELAEKWAKNRTVIEHKVIHTDFSKDRP